MASMPISRRFVNIYVADFGAAKHAGSRLVGDARAALEALSEALTGYEVEAGYREHNARANEERDREVERPYTPGHAPLLSQGQVIGAINTFSEPEDVVVCAAGSMPGDLHKPWRVHDPKGYHVEYGYTCMGYEIAGGLGMKVASPQREDYVMVGNGSYLMMSSEIITSIQEGYKLTIVLVDNSSFSSISAPSHSVGSDGFGTHYRYRKNGSIGLDSEDDPGEVLPVDLTTNAETFGARVFRAKSVAELGEALKEAKNVDWTVVIHVPVDRCEDVPTCESFWDVPVAEVSEMDSVVAACKEYAEGRQAEHSYL